MVSIWVPPMRTLGKHIVYRKWQNTLPLLLQEPSKVLENPTIFRLVQRPASTSLICAQADESREAPGHREDRSPGEETPGYRQGSQREEESRRGNHQEEELLKCQREPLEERSVGGLLRAPLPKPGGPPGPGNPGKGGGAAPPTPAAGPCDNGLASLIEYRGPMK